VIDQAEFFALFSGLVCGLLGMAVGRTLWALLNPQKPRFVAVMVGRQTKRVTALEHVTFRDYGEASLWCTQMNASVDSVIANESHPPSRAPFAFKVRAWPFDPEHGTAQ
jgi:hypothetical protein